LTATPGLEFAITASTGATCGIGRNKQEIFRCIAGPNQVSLREPPAGRYTVSLARTAAAPTATLTVEAFRGVNREATRVFTATANVGDFVRSGFTYAATTPQTLSDFDPPEVVTSICSAQSTGRLFASGTVQDRYAQLRTYAQTNKSQPVAFVVVESDVTTVANSSVPSDVPITVNDVRATIDNAGVHLSGRASAWILTVNAATDIIAGGVDGKLAIRTRSLTASPLPAGVLDPVRAVLDGTLAEFASGFPFTVRQVAMRQGCLSVMGTTPP
jgi:hypothetical protein